MSKLLLVGADTDWLEAVELDLVEHGFEAAAIPFSKLAVFAAAPQVFSAAIVAAFGHDPRAGPQGAIDAAKSLRLASPGLPILFATALPDFAMTHYALKERSIAFMPDDGSAVAIMAALQRMRSGQVAPAANPACATIEVRLDVASMTVEATLGGSEYGVGPFVVPWNGNNRLGELERFFSTYRLMRPDPPNRRRPADDWESVLQIVGQELSDRLGLSEGAQAALLEHFLERVRDMGHIHLRFSIKGDRMSNVPFELVWDTVRKLHLREVAPIARRILITAGAQTSAPASRPARATLRGPILLVRSNAHGAVSIPGKMFGAERTFGAQRLQHLEAEVAAVRRVRAGAGLSPPEVLSLGTGRSVRDALVATLRRGPWDIVHFAGHSVCANDGEVFLLLPGAAGRGPFAMRMADFAQAACEGGVGLVVLSSCESSSPDAVFRLAQAGVPVSIGFRWEVYDSEATMFTTELHRALAAGQSTARAYRAAVYWLRNNCPGSPTFASPVLTVQDETWAMAH